jgi:hypothetical protein
MSSKNTSFGDCMNYNQNFKITLWEEFKGPILTVSIAAFLMVGLHNTFYTTLSVDSKKVNVAWNSNNSKSQVSESSVVQEKEYVATSNAVELNTKSFNNTNVNTVQNDQVNEQAAAPAPMHKEEYAVINTDISVSAAEFYHPKLTTVLSGSAISGYLEVQGGEVKGLSVNINSDKAKDMGIQMISMGESQLQGNIFVYEIDGQNYTGTIYPTSPTEYMVSFVNGPWNGARVKFSTQEQQELQNENGGEQLYDQDSYSAPETDMTRREWASEESSSDLGESENQGSSEAQINTSLDGDISIQNLNE